MFPLFLTSWPRAAAVVACMFSVFPVRGQSLEQVLGQVVSSHPKLRVAHANVLAVRYEIAQSQAAKAVKFSILADPGLGYGEGYRDSAGHKKLTNAGDLGLRSTYLLYDGKRSDNDIARQEARASVAQERAWQTQSGLINAVTDAYLEVLKQEKLVQLARDNLTAHQALRDKVRGIVALDRGRQYDLSQVQARTAQAQVTLSSREGSVQEARSVLADLAGAAVSAPASPRDPGTALPSSQSEAFIRLNEHPNLRAAQADVAVAQRAADIAASWEKPRVDLQTTLNSPRNVQGERKYLSSVDARFAVQWQPFDGGAGRASAGAAAAQLVAATDNVDAVRRELSNEVARHWGQIESRRGRGPAWDDVVSQLEKVRDNHWQQFTIGKRTMLDLLNAENEAFQARLSAEQERLELLQSQYRLMGSLAQTGAFFGLSFPTLDAPLSGPSSSTTRE
jgi:outer membrane protein, adhesin transport system